jgi:hypothetical protein
MDSPQDTAPGNGRDEQHAATTGTPPDDRRDDPPLPGSEQVAERSAPATESQREALETVRSISRLEESN